MTTILIYGSSRMTELAVKRLIRAELGEYLVGYVPSVAPAFPGNVPLAVKSEDCEHTIKLCLGYDRRIDKWQNAFNVHPGILPEYGGCDILHHTIVNKETHQGFTLQKMIREYDAGPIIADTRYPVDQVKDTVPSLYSRVCVLYPLYVEMCVRVLIGTEDLAVFSDSNRFPNIKPRLYLRGDIDPAHRTMYDENKITIEKLVEKYRKGNPSGRPPDHDAIRGRAIGERGGDPKDRAISRETRKATGGVKGKNEKPTISGSQRLQVDEKRKKMKGIILAGGTGKRLAPLTQDENKHYLPVFNRRMIDFPIKTLVDLGIKDIVLITGGNKPGLFLEYLKNGEAKGIERLYYTYQHGNGGIGAALALAKPFLTQGEACTVILGDNYFGTIPAELARDDADLSGARILLQPVAEPWHFGVAEVDEKGQVFSIEEKPESPRSNLAVLGLYQFDYRVWEYLELVLPSERGEIEVVDVLRRYLDDGKLSSRQYDGRWSDMGTFNSWQNVNKWVAEGS